MARTLMLGRAGTGKTHNCLVRLARALRDGRAARLLVPTYGQAEHLRLRLLELEGSLVGRTVETFSSLAEQVTGRSLRTLAEPALRDRLGGRALAAHFPAAAVTPGLRAEFLRVVKEIKEQGEAAEAVLARARAHFPEGSRGRCLFEAFALYENLLEGSDHEDLLAETRDRLRTRPLALDLLLVDGFHDFTPIERQIVDLLADAAGEVVVTLPLDPDRPARPVFATAARTAAGFPDYARMPLRRNLRARGALAALEARLFETADDPLPSDGIERIACASDEDEADRIARLVLRAGRPLRDILVVRRSFAGMHDLYRAAFARHGIPLRFFGAEPLGATPAARAAWLWLRHLAVGLEPDEALPLLRSAYLLDAPPEEEVDRLAAQLREAGRPEDPAAFPAVAALLGRREGGPGARLGVRDALKTCPGGDFELARAHRLFRLLEREAAVLADLPPAEAAAHLLRRLALLQGAAPDRRHECVYAVEARDARQWEKPVVIVAGLDAGSFPHQVRQDLFLRDDDRRDLEERHGLHLPLRSLAEEEERYLFYVALTRASERLVLTHAAFDEEGTERAPSPYLEEALAHFATLPTRTIPLAEQYVQPRDAVSADDLLPIVADGLARCARGEGGLAAALHDRGVVDPGLLGWPRRLALMRSRPVPDLPPAVGRAFSASGIGEYLRCPYLYFARRILGVAPARGEALDPRTRGAIVHLALERCARSPGEGAGAIFDAAFAEGTRGLRLGLEEDAARRWMRQVVSDAARRMAGADILAVEHAFEVAIDDVVLRGRIDRIDRVAGGALVRDYKTGKPTLRAARDFEDVQLDAYLLAVENPVGAVYERLRSGDATGFVLAAAAGAIPHGRPEVFDPPGLRARGERMRALVREVARAVRAGRLAVRPRDPEQCTRKACDAYDLCRVARARWLARSGGGEHGA